ncbi:MAG TPA: hypothetical protein VM240_02330 [Verrucomicrobiae bacterium]|nr:hypothetical protein [Verrucomicrobiae bacterium]
MRRVAIIAAALLATFAGIARAGDDALEQVRAALRELPGTAAVRATVTRSFTSERKERPLEAGRAQIEVMAGPDGISLNYPAGLLAEVRAERAQRDPEQAKPATRTLENFEATDVADLLNRATGLTTDLDGATLQGVTEEERDGRPARRLDLDLVVRTSKADSKWVKTSSRKMKLWVTPEGLPLATESEFNMRVGLLMFNFDARDVRTETFGRAGDRLITQRLATRFDGEGLGESQHTHSDVTLALR